MVIEVEPARHTHAVHTGAFGFNYLKVVRIGRGRDFVRVILDIVGIGGSDFVGSFDIDAGASHVSEHFARIATLFHFGFLVFPDSFHVGLNGDGAAEGGFCVIRLGRDGGLNNKSSKDEIGHHKKDES